MAAVLALTLVLAPEATIGQPADFGLAPGRLLVAGRDLRDPNFAETVVLLVEHGAGGAVGLIVNRATDLPLAGVRPDLGRPGDTVWFGGPVAPRRAMLLLRTANAPEGVRRVFDDVWVGGDLDVLEGLEAGGPSAFRVYAGYAGWAPGQLEAEVQRGDWHIRLADARTVFSRDPSDLWQRLIPPPAHLRAHGTERGRLPPPA